MICRSTIGPDAAKTPAFLMTRVPVRPSIVATIVESDVKIARAGR
jgi:hypothetical protein